MIIEGVYAQAIELPLTNIDVEADISLKNESIYVGPSEIEGIGMMTYTNVYKLI